MNTADPSKILILGDKPRIAAHGDSELASIILFGSPTLDGRSVSAVDHLDNIAGPLRDRVRSFNGEFVALIETANQIIVANDRFAAIPLFYSTEQENLVLSFSYHVMWRHHKSENKLKLDPLSFYQFLSFQRLFGTTTFDKSTKVLPPGSTLTLSKHTGAVEIRPYWLPNFDKHSDVRSATASDLADAIKKSIDQKTANVQNVSLLLSGGMDSRAVLGGFRPDEQPHCLTIGESENNEVDVARSLAQLTGASHSFVQRSPDHYSNVLTRASAIGGGMYSFQHGHFFDLDIPETDLVLHGHGFDYYFQGMYLPSHRRNILGRPTRSWALDPIGPDLVGDYVLNAKYRLKGIDPASLLKPEYAAQAQERIRDDLETVLQPISGTTSESYDNWDYLTTSAPSRHYTYLNLLSASTLAEQRTIAFDNDILDIYYSTPANVRHGTKLLADTIKYLNPDLLKIRNANTNLRADLSPTSLTIESWIRGAKRRLGMGGSISADPSVDDRSWPTGSQLLSNSQVLHNRIKKLGNSEQLESIGIFDPSKIKQLADNFELGNASTAAALLTLLTIDEFIRGTPR